MGTRYSHLSDAERWAIESKLRDGLSYAQIGRLLPNVRAKAGPTDGHAEQKIPRAAERGRLLGLAS